MKSYTHNPTEVEAIQVGRPWKRVQDAIPFAHQIKEASGAFAFFKLSMPGTLDVARAYEGDWIVKHPNGYYEKLTNDEFQRDYGDSDGDSD